ncbi:helix-turn-helix domain-containing protein [Achromobacter sp. NPDC058515]|uniref:helix-turn-helix domain-containing protein n=1 Tax=Achromobacter sp. NPDC058515 TaxID=3346533 RepID=UPI003656BD38
MIGKFSAPAQAAPKGPASETSSKKLGNFAYSRPPLAHILVEQSFVELIMLPFSRMKSALSARHFPLNVDIVPVVPPQPAMLTTVKAQPMFSTGVALPDPVYKAIVECRASALRAWRNYCGLSMQTLHNRTRMNTTTLTAFDHGDVMLCEWTVGALAKALHVKPWQLLKAQSVASERQERPEILR